MTDSIAGLYGPMPYRSVEQLPESSARALHSNIRLRLSMIVLEATCFVAWDSAT
jgi:hypothetical protein